MSKVSQLLETGIQKNVKKKPININAEHHEMIREFSLKKSIPMTKLFDAMVEDFINDLNLKRRG